jgi:two-component system phosphate regulon response regulator PhoB
VVLTPTEFELLRYFLERTGRVIPRKQLLGELWAETVVTRRTIETHIANLRRKLRGFDHAFETIYGAGYRLCVAEGCP